ncbi:response regulator transcription factor [Candidatus Margulisiibacteriota bacterium]
MSKILIVEDDPSTAELIKFTVEAKGHNTLSAADGGEAVKKVRTDAPDLIVLDIMLPTMDGFQVCQILKHNKAYQSIPIIILSAKIKKEDIDKGLEKGADEYLTKPFDPKTLLLKIESFLAKSNN